MKLKNLSQVCTNAPLVIACIHENNAATLDKLVYFQTEHNLVLPGGRSLGPDDPLGVVPSLANDGQTYHVRVAGKQWYEKADIILEYNVPNIVNIQRNGLFTPEILRKIVYAPCLPWPYETHRDRKDLAVVSNVFFDGEPRRIEIMQRLSESCPAGAYQNVQGSFDLNEVRALYARTKILINFHRTEHHHSIEEFRILPALSQGCVVISEDVPLRTSIPYHEHVIWCRYDELPKTAAEVLSRYDEYSQRIHGGGKLAGRLDSMRDEFRRSFGELLSR